MSKESRIFRQADGQLISDQAKIDWLLRERRGKHDERKVAPPSKVLAGIDLSRAALVRTQPKLIGVIEVNMGMSDRPFRNSLYDIPDITIDLTPEIDDDLPLPRNSMRFILTEQKRDISIDVLFCDTAREYWKHYRNDQALEPIVKQNLLKALPAKQWQLGEYDAWSVKR